jgi:DNA polymerase III sliding clamp (beta) subunit (PCNA family)
MNRQKLIDVLEIVGRGLERNNVIPIYEYYCFTGDTVFGFNDTFGIVAPWKVDQPFGVHGPTFLGLLKASKAETVDIKVVKDQLQIKADKSEYALPYKGPDEFVWKEPVFTGGRYEAEIFKGIEYCLASCSQNLALEIFSRVCVNQHNGKIAVYSTDGDALTRYTTDIKAPAKLDICLARDFCEASLKVGGGVLEVGSEWVRSLFGDFRVYGHNLGSTTFAYEDKIAKILDNKELDAIPIPLKFSEALTRARVVADIETSPTRIFVENNELGLLTETPFGEVFDSMKVKHPDIEANVSSALLQNSMADCDQFKIRNNCTIFSSNNILRLVSNY